MPHICSGEAGIKQGPVPKLDDNYFEIWNSDQELRQEDFAELIHAELIK